MFKHILMEGHSGDDIIATLGKTGILVGDIHAFVMHSCDLVLDYVINRSEEVVALQKRMCMARTAMVNILTFGGETTFRIMLCLTQEEWTASLAIQALLSAPRQFGAAISTAEAAHGDGSSMMELVRYGNAVAVHTLLKNPEKIATAMAIFAAHSDNGFRESSMIVVLTYGNTLAIQTLIESPEKIATAMAIFSTHNLADAHRIQILLACGGVAVIKAFLEDPQKLAKALQTVASDNGFTESSMTVLLTHGGVAAIKVFLESPEKIAASTLTMVAHGFQQSSMCALLTYGCQVAVQAFINSPRNIVSTLELFRDSKSVNSGTIADRLLNVMTHGRVSVVTVLMESQRQLSHSIAVMLQNNITDPMVVFLILETGDDAVIHLMIHYPQKLADIILSSVGARDQIWSTICASVHHITKSWETVELLVSIKVTSLGQPIHAPTR